MLECHGLHCLVYMLFGLLASTFKSTQRPSMWPGSPKDSTSTSLEPECSRARRVTQSDPCGLESHQDHAALDKAFHCHHPSKISCKTHISVNRNACVHDTCCKHACQSDFLGWHAWRPSGYSGNQVGHHNEWYQSSQADYRLP